MIKIYLVSLFLLAGCSHFTFNATMCESIASDPQATIPEECRNYVEKDAEKAFNKTTHERIESNEELLEFKKEEKEEK